MSSLWSWIGGPYIRGVIHEAFTELTFYCDMKRFRKNVKKVLLSHKERKRWKKRETLGVGSSEELGMGHEDCQSENQVSDLWDHVESSIVLTISIDTLHTSSIVPTFVPNTRPGDATRDGLERSEDDGDQQNDGRGGHYETKAAELRISSAMISRESTTGTTEHHEKNSTND